MAALSQVLLCPLGLRRLPGACVLHRTPSKRWEFTVLLKSSDSFSGPCAFPPLCLIAASVPLLLSRCFPSARGLGWGAGGSALFCKPVMAFACWGCHTHCSLFPECSAGPASHLPGLSSSDTSYTSIPTRLHHFRLFPSFMAPIDPPLLLFSCLPALPYS